MNFIDRFCRTDFKSYEDFFANYRLYDTDNFNFGYDVVDALAALSPGRPALVWTNDRGEARTFTFADISRLSGKAANAFRRLGIRKGDRVLVAVKRNFQYWYILVALHKLGAVIIPATHQLTAKDIKYRIEAAGVKMFIAANDPVLAGAINQAEAESKPLELKAMVNGSAPGYLDFDAEVESSPEDFPRPNGADTAGGGDLMLMYFTSGTTGMPKMVAHNFDYPLGHILTAKFWQGLRPEDLHLTLADTGWAKCSWGKVYGQWICEAAVFVYDYDSRFQPADILEKLQQYKVTTFCAPPTTYRFLIQEDLSRYDLSSLRASFLAGEPLSPEDFRKWKKATGLDIREGFGQSETPVMLANFSGFVEPKPGSTGKPSPSLNIRLLRPDGNECEVGEEGEICVGIADGIPKGVFRGYYSDEERTGSAMFGGYYRTGDMAWFDEDGYYWFIGRSDDVIKSSGYRIGPFEVESALLEHPAVLETAVTAVPHAVRGQVVKATIVLAKGYEPSEELKVEIQNHVKRVTAPYKYPRIVEFVSELPKTVSGKIRRVQIRQEDEKKRI